MSLPYIPLYVGDYEADTSHLSLLEDGAYMRLLRLCWRTPGCKLPDDTDWIMRKMRATTDAEIAAIKAVLAEFFTRQRGKIFSRRLHDEFVRISVTLQAKKEGGKRGGSASALKRKESKASIAAAMPVAQFKQPEPEPEPELKEEDGGGGSACEPTFRQRILTVIGVDCVSGITGPSGRMIGTQADMAEAARWMNLPGMTEQSILDEIRRCMAKKRDGPPSSFKFFSPAIQRLSGELTAPALTPTAPNTGSPAHGKPAADEKSERIFRIIAAAAAGSTHGNRPAGDGDPEPILARR